MDHSPSQTAFMELPKSQIYVPNNPVLSAALAYSKEHTSPTTVNHCLRCCAFALLAMRKVPRLAEVDRDLVLLSCIFHDLGWAGSLISKDKRFEVDGANAARAWVQNHQSEVGWDRRQIQLCWDAIALHATPSIGAHKEPEVVAVAYGIMADFLGSKMPGGMVSTEEHLEIVQAFPRLGFHDTVVKIMCGFCANKPDTTYDNFIAEYGLRFGYDGKGTGKEEFAKKLEENSVMNRMMIPLKACEVEEEQALNQG